jgi:hypothetical protein
MHIRTARTPSLLNRLVDGNPLAGGFFDGVPIYWNSDPGGTASPPSVAITSNAGVQGNSLAVIRILALAKFE